MKPNYKQAILSFVPILIGILFIYMMYIQNIRNVLAWIIVLIPVFGFGIIFIGSFIDIGKYQTEDEINKYKAKLSYNAESFIIHSYSYDSIVKWHTIEAVFLINSPPLDGEYHNMEYRIIVNQEPIVIKKRSKWYDKLITSLMKYKYLMIKIDDYYNIDFKTFHPAMEEYLTKESVSTLYLNEHFGNNVECIQKDKNSSVYKPVNKPLKTMGFYKIFDRGNNINDQRLMEYRNNAKNEKR